MSNQGQVALLQNYQLGIRSSSRNLLGLDCWPKRLCLTHKLEKHKRCVNTVQWNHDGTLLISGSDDRHIGIWCGNTFRLKSYLPTNHTNNIFCAKFIPQSQDSKIITCAADGEIHFMDIHQSVLINSSPSKIHRERLSERENSISMKFEFLPSCPTAFLTTHQDGEVGLIDIRSMERNGCTENIVVRLNRLACFSLCFDPTQPNTFALSSADHLIRIYDIRVPSRPYNQTTGCLQKYSHPKLLEKYRHRVNQLRRVANNATDVQFSSSGELLVNYSMFDVVLFDSQENWKPSSLDPDVCTNVIQRYKGRVNQDTFLKEARFYGSENYVVTGSDSGKVFIWNKKTAQLVRRMPADKLVVNGISPHPILPSLATCGIDSDVKIFQTEFGNDLDNEQELSGRFLEVLSSSTRSLPFRFGSRSELGLELFTVSQAKESLANAAKYRLSGDEFLEQNEFSRAASEYEHALGKLKYSPPGIAHRREQTALTLTIHDNLLKCYAKLARWDLLIRSASLILLVEQCKLNGYYYRALGYLHLSLLSEAAADIIEALELYPNEERLLGLKKILEEHMRNLSDAPRSNLNSGVSDRMFSEEESLNSSSQDDFYDSSVSENGEDFDDDLMDFY